MMQAVEKRTLETIVGPLAQTFRQLERATILHSDQLTTERRTNPALRHTSFYTADSSLYTIEREREKGKGLLGKIKSFFGRDKEAFLYLGREPTNLIFNNIREGTLQLISTGEYILPEEKRKRIDAVIKAEDTLKVKLSDLKLQRYAPELCYFEIETADYDKLNSEQRRVAERVYGEGNDFKENMKMFNEAGISTTRVYVLNPNYIKKKVSRGGALPVVSALINFGGNSDFGAGTWDVDAYFGLRGVRKRDVVTEGDAPKIEVDPIEQAYRTLLRDPKLAVQKMTPQIATGLSGLLQMYNPQKQ